MNGNWIAGTSLALALMLSARVTAGPIDKPADFIIDMSSVCGDKVGLRIRTKKGFWQLPLARVRKGFGIVFYVVGDSKSNSSQARVYVEVEPLDDRVMADAAAEAADALADVMAPFDTELVGKVTKADVRRLKIGKDFIPARKLHYTVDIVTADPRTKNPATAVVFTHKKALVTVTVEEFEKDKDYLDKVLRSITFVKLPAPGKAIRVKLLDAAEHIHRYITLALPKPFVAQYADCAPGVAATFVHRDAKPGVARPQITLQRLERPRERGMDKFENVAKWRHSDFADSYHDVSELTKLRVSGSTAYRTTYTDKTEQGDWRIFDVVFPMREQIWVLTMESNSKDPKAAKDAEKVFRKMLTSVAIWVGS